jgi:DNA repair photolyase
MRWDNLRDDADGQGALFGLDRVGVRTFDTPEFRGMTFYEVRARSAINKVPAAARVPFQWTINPYRGCSHACVYCLAGDTPILLADGRTRPLADLRVGDEVFGTTVVEGDGTRERAAFGDGPGRRRYTATRVLAHWRTVKRAYRVTLRDGTEVVASGDHRFLTRRGWKYVTGARRRPHLTVNDQLLGTGAFAAAPERDTGYRLGYLCGMVRGEAVAGTCTRTVGGDMRRFRLALTDLDARRRSRDYLAAVGIATAGLAEAVGQRHTAHALPVDAAAFPERPGAGWRAGFLAGILDAEGTDGPVGALRVADADPRVLAHVVAALRERGFGYLVQAPDPDRGFRTVRLLGGLRDRLRLLHGTDPATGRGSTVDGAAVGSDAGLRVASVEPLGVSVRMYDITTGTGDFIANGVVSHNCFARKTHTYLDLDSGHDFDSRVVVKINTPELVRAELGRRSWRGEPIAMGTNVDCYQRAEGRYRLMPGVIEALRDARNPFSILTKGSLILRDLPLLREAAEVTDVAANVSVGFVDGDVWRSVEPGTPAPRKRLEVCATLNAAGIGCGVLMAPVLPYLTDSADSLAATVRAIAETGARHVTPIVLHLRPGAREWFMAWLAEHHPDLVARYRALYGRGAYAPKEYQQRIGAQVAGLAERYGMNRRGPGEARRQRAAPAAASAAAPVAALEQPTLL